MHVHGIFQAKYAVSKGGNAEAALGPPSTTLLNADKRLALNNVAFVTSEIHPKLSIDCCLSGVKSVTSRRLSDAFRNDEMHL